MSNQYCFDINNPTKIKINYNELKLFVENIYKSRGFEDEELPFITIHAKNEEQICIVLTSKNKGITEKINKINAELETQQLQFIPNIFLTNLRSFDVDTQTWWMDDTTEKTYTKWTSLRHQGPYFPNIMEPYEPLGAMLIYNGISYTLTSNEERIASFYARRIISEENGGVVESLTTNTSFNNNFWNDFKNYLTLEHKRLFINFSKLDFSDIVLKIRNKKENEITSIQKKIKKTIIEENKRNYGYGYIDSRREKIGNYSVELSSLFLGRGDNPKRGKIKPDITPEDVTINIGVDDPIPQPPQGHTWGDIVHDTKAIWLSKWKDPITRTDKYIFFSNEGQFKGQGDLLKYEKARKLNEQIDNIRKTYQRDAKMTDIVKKQLGTVLYLIETLGIRVGNETGEDDSDTFGATTLLCGHVKTKLNSHIVFDFLGKDSIRFFKDIIVPKYIYDNILGFKEGKKEGDSLFSRVSSSSVNEYIKKFDNSFTAKVFRTRLASTIMYDELNKIKIPQHSTKQEIKLLFNIANAKVASFLNHTKNSSIKSKDSIDKQNQELKKLIKERKGLTDDKKIKLIDKKIKSKKTTINSKKTTQSVAIGTSLINYIDPRVIISWCKKNNMDLKNIYSDVLLKKFFWAISTTDENWDYILNSKPSVEQVLVDMNRMLKLCKENRITLDTIKTIPFYIIEWIYKKSKKSKKSTSVETIITYYKSLKNDIS